MAPHDEPEVRAQAPWGTSPTQEVRPLVLVQDGAEWGGKESASSSRERQPNPASEEPSDPAQCMFTGGKVAGT